MDQKLLTESGWKSIAQKFQIKDNGLQGALADYSKLEDDQHDELLKAIGEVRELALALKKTKEAAAVPEVLKYLAGVVAAAESQQHEIMKAKAAAQKQAQAQAKASQAVKKDEEEQEEQEEEEGKYQDKLLKAFQKLKGAKDLSFEFVVCDARPFCGLMMAKKISTKHKQELSEITNSKRFLPLGTCRFESGHYVFALEHPPSGLARRLQESIKNFTGKKLPIVVGTETAEEEEEPSASGQARETQSAAPNSALEEAPQLWNKMRQGIETRITQLKTTVLRDLGDESPEVLGEIKKNISSLDHVLDSLDQRLAESLSRAQAARDGNARQTELKKAKGILADYINFVKSEDALLVHIDSNPFGVQTNLKQTLTDGLKHMAQALG